LSGEFSAAIGELQAKLVELRALTEAMLDFPKRTSIRFTATMRGRRLEEIRRALDEVLRKSRQGSLLRSGIHVVLAGRPNVGKSSLLNRLAGEERAIVTPIPGTTRDSLREPVQIDGVPLVVVDTAGLRESGDEIERLGMQRTQRELERAIWYWWCSTRAKGPDPLRDLPAAAARIDIYNKIDLAPGFAAPPQSVAVLGQDRRRSRAAA
jgi:tRNA modification GTPase